MTGRDELRRQGREPLRRRGTKGVLLEENHFPPEQKLRLLRSAKRVPIEVLDDLLELLGLADPIEKAALRRVDPADVEVEEDRLDERKAPVASLQVEADDEVVALSLDGERPLALENSRYPPRLRPGST